jgi:glyoxylase-like metal-dependent hydrolase (beta-lactamase superfamily II)
MMLFDRENSILFTGDTFYPAALYAHLDSGGGMVSDFGIYRKTLGLLARRFGDVKTLYCSHNEPVVPGRQLGAAAEAFDAIARGGAPCQTDAAGLRLYVFDGFSVVVGPEKQV